MEIPAHIHILRRSLGTPAMMRRDTFTLIMLSNCLVDAHQLRSAWHFDNGYDRGAICRLWDDGLHTLIEQVVASCEPVNKARLDLRSRWRALVALGRASHALQDFYAHTNWIELTHRWQEPYQIAPLLEDRLVPEDLPADLCSGFFSVRYLTPRHAFSGCPVRNGSYTPPDGFAYCHAQLAKDSPKGHGGERIPGDSSTLFEIAVDLATTATRQLWDDVRRRLLVVYGAEFGEWAFRQLAWGRAE